MGPWAGLMSSLFGFPIPVKPQKGQTIRVKALGPPFKTMITWSTNYSTTTRDDGLIYHGATHEDSGFNEEPTIEGRDNLLQSLVTLAPSLIEAEVALQTACLRPIPDDGLPIIGKVPDWPDVYLATGHGRKGILLSPVTGHIITELILKGDTSIPIDPFSITRFRSIYS